MNAERLQSIVDSGEFLDVLMQEINIRIRPCAESSADCSRLDIEFPEWFSTLLTEETQTCIIRLIRQNAQAVADASLNTDP